MNHTKNYIAGSLSLIASISGVAAQQVSADKMNIILIVSDDHGKDAVGCYGNPVVKTPNIDKLAAEGVRFTNAYCTSASSAASRSVLLTGRYGHAIGAYGHTHAYHHFSTYDDVLSLPVLLSQDGYYTARIGKYHVAPESVYAFDKVIPANARNTVQMAERSAEVFKSEKPFFLYFCSDDPHRSGFMDNDDPQWDTPNPFGNLVKGYEGVETITFDPKEVIVPDFLPDNKETREEIAQYYQSIARLDQGVGRLLTLLKESGKEKNTLVIYIADNGVAFPGAKTTVYEDGIGLPCIIKDPRIQEKGVVNNAMISWVDMTPTLLDYAGIKFTKQPLHGRSFKDIIPESNPKGWDTIFASHTFHEVTMYYPMRVLHKREYKLIWNPAWRMEYPFASDLWESSSWQSIYRAGDKVYGNRKIENYINRPEFELYDISNDPSELNNLSNKRQYKELLDEMVTELKEWQKQTNDPWYILWNMPSLTK